MPVRFSQLVKAEDGKEFPKILKVPMFRVGDYGEKGRYTESDLDAMASSYDPAYLEAPVTRDHVDYGPADGWIDRVFREGDTLFGDWTVHPDTLALLQEGKYKRRSIEFYRKHKMPDGSTVPYVKACSILGAATPHCKGMPNISFADVSDDDVAFDFESEPKEETHQFSKGTKKMPTFKLPAQYARFADRFTDDMSEEDRSAQFAAVLEEAAREQAEKDEALKVAQTKLSENDKTIAALNDKVETQGKTVAEIIADNRRTKAEAKFTAAITENREKVTPVLERYLKTLFDQFAELPVSETIEFSENDEATPAAVHPCDLILGFIANLTDVVSLSQTPVIHNMHQHNKPSKIGSPDRSDPKAMEEFNAKVLKLAQDIERDEKMDFTDAMIEAERRLTA